MQANSINAGRIQRFIDYQDERIKSTTKTYPAASVIRMTGRLLNPSGPKQGPLTVLF